LRAVLRTSIRIACTTLVGSLLLVTAPDGAMAQKKKKKKETPAAAPAAPDPAAAQPSGPPPPTPEQKEQAGAAFQAGQAAEKAGNFDEAIASYQKAFEIYPDPVIQLVLGEAHRKKADQAMQGEGYDQAVPEFEKAKAAYEKYLELAPQGAEAEAARNRIEVVTASIANAKQLVDKQKADEDKKAKEAAEAERKAEEAQRAEAAAGSGTQIALDGLLIAGLDQDATALARFMPGALLGWGRFALEAHIAFEGFLRVQNDKGVSARSVSLDLGARYGFKDARFRGLFASGGASYGLFGGKPRDRKLTEDMTTCGGFEGNNCAFDVDKSIGTRFGLGYGFEASKKTTVALRLDAMYWFFSVDGEQETDSPPAGLVDKPQTAIAFLLGLEFLHWP
jgi:tetratricopeptide (TPR) repeat protein